MSGSSHSHRPSRLILEPNSGSATIDGAFTNHGTVNGPSGVGQSLTFIDDVNGAGNYTGNVEEVSAHAGDGFTVREWAAVVSGVQWSPLRARG
jgi:hypothetical protein